MSGGRVPYHQRQNKAVDRHLFVDLLVHLNRVFPVANSTYVGFGGPFLEDFKLMHAAFGNRKLISLEMSDYVHKRQIFNKPLGCIELRKTTSSDFIDNYNLSTKAVIWLDYASANRQREQIQEFQTLLSKLRSYDVVKITLNANPDTLRPSKNLGEDGKRETAAVCNALRLKNLQEQMGESLPHGTTAEDMTGKRLPGVLVHAIEFVANEAFKGRPELLFQPLTSFVYNDAQHQMVTVTGIILAKQERTAFFKRAGLTKSRFALSWDEPLRIDLPALTAKERLFIDQLLPGKGPKAIQTRLKFLFVDEEADSLEILRNYVRFYRQYPNFHRVVF